MGWDGIGVRGSFDSFKKRGNKTYIYRDEDVDAIVLLPRMTPVVPFLCRVVTNHQGVLGQFLVEALGAGAVDEEVERLSNGAQRE